MDFYHVLRMGHRPERDKRITSHVALTSRAFGAEKMYLHRSDSRVVETVRDETVRDVVGKFGGNFVVEPTDNPKKIRTTQNISVGTSLIRSIISFN